MDFPQVFDILHVSMAYFAYIKRICRRTVQCTCRQIYIFYIEHEQ